MPTWPDLARHHLAFFFDPAASVQGWRVWRALPIDPAGVGQGVDLAAAQRAGAEITQDADGGVREVLIRRAPDLPNPGESVLADIFPGAVFRDRSLLQQSIRLDRRPDGPVAHFLWQADPAGRDPTVIRGRPAADEGLDLSLLALTEEAASAYGGTPQLLSGGVWHLLQREPGAGGWWALPAASWIGLDAGRQHALRQDAVTIPAPDPVPSETPMSPPSIDQAPDADEDLDEDAPEPIPAPTSAGKRADFGEHIGGSRKDMAGHAMDRALTLRVETLTQLGTLSGRQDPLSQSQAGKHLRGLRRDVLWPAPSAATLNARRAEGADPWALLFAEWMRQTTRRHAAEGMRLKYVNTQHLEQVALGHLAALTLVQERLAGVRTPADLLALSRAPYSYGRVEPRLQQLLRQHQGSEFEDLMASLREQVPPSETLSFWTEILRTEGRGWPRAATRALQPSAPERWLADQIESVRAPAQDGIDALRAVFDAHQDQVNAQHRDILAAYDVPKMRAAWAPRLADLRDLSPAVAMLAARDHQMLQILYLEHLMQGPVLADWMEGQPLHARDPIDRGGHYQIRADPDGEHYWHLNDHLRLRFLLGAGGNWLADDPARQQRVWTRLHDLVGLETAPDGLAVASLPRKAKSKASASQAADAPDADDATDADAPADQDADAPAEAEQAPARVIWSQKTPAPRYEHLVREGPRRRPVMPGFDPADPSAPARNVTEAEFCEAFGIRAVEYGNWATQRERQDMLDMCYDSLADMAEALDLPYRAMGFDGDLAVAIGARGQGGSAAGHYEPSRRVINFTKTKGTGVLAHEWSHALDYWLGRQFGSRHALSTQIDINPPLDGEAPNASQAMTAFMKGSKSRANLLSLLTTGVPPERRGEINDAARAEIDAAKMQHRFRAAMQMLAKPKLRTDWEQALDLRGRYPGDHEPIDPALVPRDWMRHAPDIARRLAEDGLSAAFKLDIRTWQYNARLFTQTISAALAEARAKQPRPDTAEADTLRDKLRDVADATLSGEIGYKGARALLWRKFRQIDDVFHQHGAQTLFALNAQMLDAGRSPYWSTDVELFARAFSAVIHDRLAGIGVRNDFASAFSAPDAFGGHAFVGNPNPEGIEREGMGRLAEPLLGAVQTLTAGMHPEPDEDRRARASLKMA